VFSHEVDEPFLSWCRDQERLGLWSALEVDFKEVLEVEPQNAEAALEELAVDFCQLFVTSGRLGTPHESVHASEAREAGEPVLLWGDPASELKHLYREAGFELDEESHQLPDAIGVELEFMERLTEQEAAARKEHLADEARRLEELQRRMLNDHLGQWLPDYARRLKGSAATDFYRAMLDLAADFIESEAKRIGALR
jgi:TorA maturation chaperone TorD